jgi:anthranilate synthase component 1
MLRGCLSAYKNNFEPAPRAGFFLEFFKLEINMLFSQITTTPGEVASISLKANYVEAPIAAFETLTKDNDYALLLESAEIDSKDNLKSLMLIDSAVKLECNGQQVIAEALNENGQNVIDFLSEQFATLYSEHCISQTEGTTLTVTFNSLSTEANEETRLKQINAFEGLRAVIKQIKCSDSEPFSLFLGGAFAYDMLANFEQLPDVPLGKNTCPDYVFYLAESLLVIDHQHKTTEIIGNVFSGENAYANCFTLGKQLERIRNTISQLTSNREEYGFEQIQTTTDVAVSVSDAEFNDAVLKLKENIVQGDIFQVVPSRCFSLSCEHPLDAFRHLVKDNPSPYMFYLKHKDFVLFGASPESALKFEHETRQVEVYPIAGTRKRGFNADGSMNLDLDSRIELELQNDHKEVAEHLMLVDLARNDVARISEPGSRFVKELLKVDRYSYVMHLVSKVVGQLRQDLDALHAYQACMNMGTLVGAPKIKAATLIREFEQERRGSYGGAVGYLNGLGDMDTCIVIRSAFVKDGLAHVQAGAGVVYDSDPQSESNETFNKAQAVIKAVTASQTYISQSDKE